MKFVEKILNNLEELLVAAGIGAASLILFVNVVMRYVFNSGWEWAEEVARYTIVWIVFLGGSICARKGMHLAVDAVAIRLSDSGQKKLRLLVDGICASFCLFLVYFGWEMVILAQETDQLTPGLEIPIFYVYVAIPVGGALMAFRFMQDIYCVCAGITTQRATEAS